MPLSTPFRHSVPHTDQLLGEAIHVNEVGWLRKSFGEAYQHAMQQAPMIYRYHWNEGRTMSEFLLVLIPEGEGELDIHVTNHAKGR